MKSSLFHSSTFIEVIIYQQLYTFQRIFFLISNLRPVCCRMVCTGGRTILILCLTQKKKMGANMVASILAAGLEKDTDIYPFFCAGWSPFTELTGGTSTWTRKPAKPSGITRRKRMKRRLMKLDTQTDNTPCHPG